MRRLQHAVFPGRRKRSGFGEVLFFLGLGLVWVGIMILRKVGGGAVYVIWYLVLRDPEEERRQAAIRAQKASKKGSLRSTSDWKRHFQSARSLFVRTCEEALGAAHLHCACCQVEFPTRSPRGFHVDHILPVATNPELSFDVRNFQLLCATCNLDKSDGQPLAPERRPKKLVAALERTRREWLRNQGGTDPIHALMATHAAKRGGR